MSILETGQALKDRDEGLDKIFAFHRKLTSDTNYATGKIFESNKNPKFPISISGAYNLTEDLITEIEMGASKHTLKNGKLVRFRSTMEGTDTSCQIELKKHRAGLDLAIKTLLNEATPSNN